MQLILLSIAIIIACSGFVWAILRIQQINQSIRTVWPDWEGIKSPMPLWILLALASIIGIAGGVISSRGLIEEGGPEASETTSTEAEAYQAEITQLRKLLSEATRPQILTEASTPVSSPPAPSPPPQATTEIPLPENEPATPSSALNVDPRVEELSRAVVKAVISGSMKPLEPVAAKSLLDQFTINPFNFSRLQIPLKSRLEAGYTPVFLGRLQSPIGVTYLWKIETVNPGPDILERLAIANGRVTGFRFDGIK